MALVSQQALICTVKQSLSGLDCFKKDCRLGNFDHPILINSLQRQIGDQNKEIVIDMDILTDLSNR